MKKKEKKVRQILEKAIAEVLDLGFHIRTPSEGVVPTRDGQTITRVDQLKFEPIPDELKRRRESGTS